MATVYVGDRIRELREQRGLSQAALRRVSGISISVIYRAERGDVVSPNTARRLAAALGCKPADLLPPVSHQ